MNKFRNKKLVEILQIIAIIITITLLIINPKLNMSTFLNGLELWAMYVLPTLFPILFVTSILNYSGSIRKLGKVFAPITTKLFNCSGISGYIYLMSILSGYPVGAKITSELYENGVIDSKEASRITAFSSTSGPLFILGTVGIGMFNNQRIGIVILLSHLLGALLNGIVFRNLYRKKFISSYNIPKNTTNNILETCMLSSIKGILVIGGYIALSYMVISIINSYNLFLPITSLFKNTFNINPEITNSIINGLIEITKGVKDISALSLSPYISSIISTAIISMGGICITLQAYTYLAKFKIKMKLFILEKFVHTLLSAGICAILGVILL